MLYNDVRICKNCGNAATGSEFVNKIKGQPLDYCSKCGKNTFKRAPFFIRLYFTIFGV